MAEAHARLHLRENVLEADVSMAIRMMLESFIEAQKFSVMKKMRSTFQKYLAFQKDHSELLFFILRQLTLDQLAYIRCKDGPSATNVEIMERDLIERAKQLDISNLKPFYESELFRSNGFSYDPKRRTILQIVVDGAV